MDFPTLDDTLSPSQLLTGHDYSFPSTTVTDGERTTILSLPTEILLRITHLLTLPPYYALIDGTPQPITNPLHFGRFVTWTLKSLRLTHPNFQYLPLPYLFLHLTLPLFPAKHPTRGLLRLYSISTHPHLATYVQHIKFWVQFNLAEPHPAPFSEGNLRSASQDLLSVRDPPPRRRDRWRSSISGALEGLSLGGKKGRRVSKARGTAPVAENDGAVRSGSTVSTSSVNGDVVAGLQRQQSTFPPLPDYRTAPVEFLETFNKMAQTTISRNLGLQELTIAAEKNVGPSPMLLAMMGFMSEVFSRFSRLQTLCVDSQTQEEFMEKLDRRYALRYSPVQDTWEAISGYVVAMVVAGWVKSSCQGLRRLWVMGGAVGWGKVLMREYLAGEKEVEGIVWMENGLERKEAKCANGSEEQTGLEMWKEKAARLESLILKYDVGAYRKYIGEVETQWMSMVRELVQEMPRLQYLEIGKQNRADGTPHLSVNLAVRLSNIASQGWQDGNFRGDLKMLRVGDVQVTNSTDLKRCLEALGGEKLERLYMGNFEITTDDWPAAWRILREGCRFKLKKFELIGKRYGSVHGYWTPNQHWLARWDGDISCLGDTPPLLGHLQEYVEGKREAEDYPLSLTEEVGARAAFEQWQRQSGETLKYTPYRLGT